MENDPLEEFPAEAVPEPAAEFPSAPPPSPADSDDVIAVRALRKHVRRHNWQALLLATLSFLFAVFLWGLVYLLVYWIALVIVTVDRSFNPATLLEVTNPQLLGRWFPACYGVGILVMLIAARIISKRINLNKLRERRLYVLWVFLELFLAVPNVTFSIWGNLRAIVRLRRGEALACWRVLERIKELGGRLLIAHVAGEIPDQATLPRVLVVLQIAELLGVRENDDGWFYYLQNRDAIPALREPAPVPRAY